MRVDYLIPLESLKYNIWFFYFQINQLQNKGPTPYELNELLTYMNRECED